jgi:hypothetical protein
MCPADLSQRAGRDRREDDIRRRVSHARIKFPEHGGQPIEIVRLPRRAEIEVPGLAAGAVELGAHPTDQHELDPVALEDFHDPPGIERRTIRVDQPSVCSAR